MARTKIGFVLLSNTQNPLPSTRISVINMLPYLRAANYEPEIVFDPRQHSDQPDVSGLAEHLSTRGVGIAYFQKVHGQSVLREVRKLAAFGIRTVYGVCDLIEDDMAEATDATVAVTEYLKSLYAPQIRHKISVVHDGIEAPDIYRDYGARGGTASARTPLKVVLVTSSDLLELPVIKTPPRFAEVTVIGYYPPTPWLQRAKKMYWQSWSIPAYRAKFRFIRRALRRGFKPVNWDIKTVYQSMVRADVAIIPVDMSYDPLPGRDVSYWQVKSENRLTMKMSLALPVIASPVPSYLGVIDQAKNGFIASTRDEWVAYLEELCDPEQRRHIGQRARACVVGRFSKDEQARKLIEVFNRLIEP